MSQHQRFLVAYASLVKLTCFASNSKQPTVVFSINKKVRSTNIREYCSVSRVYFLICFPLMNEMTDMSDQTYIWVFNVRHLGELNIKI